MGTTNISSIGGTITGAISSLNSNINNYMKVINIVSSLNFPYGTIYFAYKASMNNIVTYTFRLDFTESIPAYTDFLTGLNKPIGTIQAAAVVPTSIEDLYIYIYVTSNGGLKNRAAIESGASVRFSISYIAII